jgi:transcription initiation factor TFIID subunit TAF12
MRRRARRRGLLAGAVAGGAIAHHRAKRQAQDEQAQDEQAQDEQAQAGYGQAPVEQSAYAPPPPTSADQIEHLAQLHSSGVLTDEEFASAKAKVLGI